MEQFFLHNRVKLRIAHALESLMEATDLGYLFINGARLSNLGAKISCEPDFLFVSHATFETKRAVLLEGVSGGHVEMEDIPDMVGEVVSDSSVTKDTVRLREFYADAGIPEYWLIDAREHPVRFDLLKLGPKGYSAARRLTDGWLKSNVFQRSFRLTEQTDPRGNLRFTLAVRP